MSKVDKRIIELTNENWEKNQKALLLSTLGYRLNREFDLEAELRGAKLLTYVRLAVGDKIHIKRHPSNPIVWGLIPAAASLPESEDELAQLFKYPVSAKRASARFGGGRIAYDQDLWRCFSIPKDEDKRRYIVLGPPIQASDIGAAEVAPEGSIEIPADAIIPRGPDAPKNRNQILSDKIREWAEANQIELSAIATSADRHHNLLDEILHTLSDSELSSIQVSLSIVKKLRQSGIR